MMGFDERETQKEYKEDMKNPAEALLDDEDDETFFEIAVINRKNSALVTDCKVRMGEINFDRFFIIKKDADAFVRNGIWFDKLYKKGIAENPFYGQTHGPKFTYLSESLQNNMVEYLYSVGLRPEIGICVEYLSWNKEQRMYMSWLKKLYSHLFMDSAWSWDLNVNNVLEEAKQGLPPTFEKLEWLLPAVNIN